MFFEIVTSSAGIIQPWIRGYRGANSGKEITAVNCITNHEGLSVFHFSICQQFFFSSASAVQLAFDSTNINTPAQAEQKNVYHFFFFFFVPFAKICDRFIHRQRQRFSPTFVFLWPITNLQQLLLLNRDFRRQQKLINNKSL